MNPSRIALAISFLLDLGAGVVQAQLDNPAYQVNPGFNPARFFTARIGEFTGDGILDVVASQAGSEGAVSIWPGLGDGTFGCADPCVPPVILASVASSEPDDAPGRRQHLTRHRSGPRMHTPSWRS